MTQDDDFDFSPAQLAFEVFLQNAVQAKKSFAAKLRLMTPQVLQDMVKHARAVTVEELIEGKYVSRLADAGLLGREGGPGRQQAGDGLEIVAAFLDSGALLSVPEACDSGLLVRLAMREPERWKGQLAGSRVWAESSCEIEFSPNGVGHALARELAAPHRGKGKGGIAGETGEAQTHQANLIRASNAAGRLEALNETGRGAAWLMNCLLAAPLSDAREAIAAGIRLDGVSPDALRRFAQEMLRAPLSQAQRFLDEKGGTARGMRAKKDQACWAELKDGAARDLWERWALAIEAGLPPVDWASHGRFQARGEERPLAPDLSDSLPLAILAQEALRAGISRGLCSSYWMAACRTEPWPQAIAELAGAQPGESSMAWAIRHGFGVADWSHADLEHDLGDRFSETGIGDRAQVLEDLAHGGLRLPRSKDKTRGLVAQIFKNDGTPRAMAALLKMGADFHWRDENGVGLVAFLMAEAPPNQEGWARECGQMLELLEAKNPGTAKELLEMKDKKGAQAIHAAGRRVNLHALKMCVDAGADVNAQDNRGDTVMHWAARTYGAKAQPKFLPLASLLKANGFDWTLANKQGLTAMGALAKKGPVDAIVAIADAAADVLEKKDAKGKSPMDHLRGRTGVGEAVAAVETLVIHKEMEKAKEAFANEGGEPSESEPPQGAKRSPRRM